MALNITINKTVVAASYPAGSTVATAVASGGTTPYTYSIATGGDYFNIDSSTGVVTTKALMDASSIQSFSVTATDSNSTPESIISGVVYPNIQAAIQNKFSKFNVIYKIVNDIDLGNAVLTIPANCTLDFQGGSFSNGTINLNKAIIKANTKVFNNITILNPSNNEIFIDWFGISNLNNVIDMLSKYIESLNLYTNFASWAYITIKFLNREYTINTPIIVKRFVKIDGEGTYIKTSAVKGISLDKYTSVVNLTLESTNASCEYLMATGIEEVIGYNSVQNVVINNVKLTGAYSTNQNSRTIGLLFRASTKNYNGAVDQYEGYGMNVWGVYTGLHIWGCYTALDFKTERDSSTTGNDHRPFIDANKIEVLSAADCYNCINIDDENLFSADLTNNNIYICFQCTRLSNPTNTFCKIKNMSGVASSNPDRLWFSQNNIYLLLFDYQSRGPNPPVNTSPMSIIENVYNEVNTYNINFTEIVDTSGVTNLATWLRSNRIIGIANKHIHYYSMSIDSTYVGTLYADNNRVNVPYCLYGKQLSGSFVNMNSYNYLQLLRDITGQIFSKFPYPADVKNSNEEFVYFYIKMYVHSEVSRGGQLNNVYNFLITPNRVIPLDKYTTDAYKSDYVENGYITFDILPSTWFITQRLNWGYDANPI